MSINTAVNIDVNVDGTQSVKQASLAYEDLGDAFAKTQRQAEELALQYGINDERTKEAIKTAGRYKQQLEQLDQAIDAHRGGQETLFRAVQGVTAGFEVATGAMALFGNESEDLQKILMKVQGAMIFSQGLKDLKEFAPAIMNIVSATRAWYVSLSLVQKSFLTLGIGLVIGLVVKLADSFSSVSEETLKASKAQEEYNKQIKDLRLERVALLQGELVASQIKYNEALNERNKLQQRNVQIQEELLRQQQAERLAGIEFDSERKQRLQQELKDNTLRVEQLINDEIKLSNKIKDLKAQEVASKTKTTKDGNDKEAEERRKSAETFRIESEKARREYNAVQSQQLKSSSDEIINNTRLAIESTNVVFNESIEKQMSSLQMLKLSVGAFGADFVNTFMTAFEAVAVLEEAYASSSEQSQKKAFEIRKALSITQATIATIESTINAFNTASSSPITTLFPAYPFIQAGLASAFGIAQIKQIGKQQFNSTSLPSRVNSIGGSVSVPTTLRASSVNVGNEFVTADRRVYVLQGDITRTINNVNNTRAVSVVE